MWTVIRDFWAQLDPALKTQFMQLLMMLVGLKSFPRNAGPDEDKAKAEMLAAECPCDKIEEKLAA